MAIRQANVQDISRILEIYAPYVKTTAISFEYTVPSLEAFTQRFLGITAQFPWLVWEEDSVILGYAYGSRPFERKTTPHLRIVGYITILLHKPT